MVVYQQNNCQSYITNQQFLIVNMARRNISPAKGRALLDPSIPAGLDERDMIIKKLKDELIIARGNEKEVVILGNYLREIKEKIKLAEQQIKRKQLDLRTKTDLSQKAINELKREIEIRKGQLKSNTVELGEREATLVEMKRHLAKRGTEIDKIKKQTLCLNKENQEIAHQNSKSQLKWKQIKSQLQRIQATNRDYEARLSDINSKIGEIKGDIDNLNTDSKILKDQLKKHEQQNNDISDDLSNKQDKIQDLQRVFAEQHDQIKYQIDTFIELEHKNERILTEIRHKINLNKSENEKSADLSQTIQKIEKSILIVNRENQEIDEEIRIQKDEKNKLNKYNSDLSQDLNKCQAHLQNLMKYNSQIQDELEKYLREDEQIIAIIRKKMAVDVITMRESRKLTDRTYL